jgi:AraC-like DNA-binding protein
MDLADDLLRRVRVVGAELRWLEPGEVLDIDLTDQNTLALVMPMDADVAIHGRDAELLVLSAGSTAVVRARSVRLAPSMSPVLVGSCRIQGEAARRLVAMLPSPLVLSDAEECATLHRSLRAERALSAGDGGVVRNRLVEWLLVCTLRAWFDGSAPRSSALPVWHRGIADEKIGPVLLALHGDPRRQWTVNSLAGVSGLSRTAFSERFSRLLGDPPLQYLTRWRMSLAADLLTESTETVAVVAGKVGYADAFGFSTAFKRAHGMSPTDYRQCSSADECVSGAC